MRLDHVIYGVRDLDAAATRFRDDYGLDSVPGGEHTGFGTANRIVPLGDSYIELMGVVDPAGGLAQWVLSVLGEREGAWLGWCVATGDIAAVAARLGEDPVPMQRERPDGSVLSWRLAGLMSSMQQPSLPFFIQWDDPAQHPGRAGEPQGAITEVRLTGDPAAVRAHLDGADLPVAVAEGDQAVGSVTVRTARGSLPIG